MAQNISKTNVSLYELCIFYDNIINVFLFVKVSNAML